VLTRTDVILRNALKINRDEGHSRETAAPGNENISSRSSKQFAKRRLFDDSAGSSRPLTSTPKNKVILFNVSIFNIEPVKSLLSLLLKYN